MVFEYYCILDDPELDRLCFSTPRWPVEQKPIVEQSKSPDAKPSLTATIHERDAQIEGLQHQNSELREELEASKRTLGLTMEALQKAISQNEVIGSQSARLEELENKLRLVGDELERTEKKKRSAELQSETRARRVSDLEQQVKNLNSELLEAEHKAQTSASRLSDVVSELTSLQSRLEVQRNINETLETQLVQLQFARATAAPPPTHLYKRVLVDKDESAQLSSSTEIAVESGVKGQAPMKSNAATTVALGAPFSKKSEPDFVLAQQLEADLLSKCQMRDDAEAKLRKLENAKVRTMAEKSKRDALSHEVNVLSHEISDIRTQLRSMQQLFR